MDRSSEKEKTSRKERESHKDHHHKDRERDNDRERGRDRDHKHRSKEHHRHRSKERDYNGVSSGEDGDRYEQDHRSKHHKSRKERGKSSDDLRRSREYSEDRDSRRDREGSKDRVSGRELMREKSYEREGSRERSLEPSHSYKRKDRGESEDRNNAADKRIRVSDAVNEDKLVSDAEERKDKKNDVGREKRRFEDRVKEEDDSGFSEGVKSKKEDRREDLGNGRKRERRRFEDKEVKLEEGGGDVSLGGSNAKDGVAESSRNASENVAPSHPPATKVSSISTTNENKGVNITGSHAVTGKSSTDGTATAAGKSETLSLDALAKAKKVLQMQKELSEKLKKTPLFKKVAGSNADIGRQSSSKEEAPPSITGVLPTTSSIVTASTLAPESWTSSGAAKPVYGLDAAKIEAVKCAQELAAKMGFRQDPQFAPLINLFPGQPQDVSVIPKPAKAPVLRLDALGREIDEQGNVVNAPKINTLSTLKVNINKQKKDAFQILKPELEVDPEQNPHFDPRMGLDKTKILRPKRMTFQFVEEGKWSKDAEIIKLKSQFGDAQAKELKTKQAQLAKAKAEPNVNPNLIEIGERVITKERPKEPIPEVEWWDVPILRSGNYSDIADSGSVDDKLKTEKITIYVVHPRPIEPPAEPAPPPPQALKLTKKEHKKLKTQQRLAREKDRQEMIRQGLLEPPKPKVKMSNLMKVLGSEATQDPTRLEMEIRTAAAEREQAHIDRNIARKLTPAERREKKERKLFDDPSKLETIVSVYKINDLSNTKNRFKVDINARENHLTGCALIYEDFSIVIAEGGGKSIKRYDNLMLRRIDWAAKLPTEDDEEDEEDERPVNKCLLVWQGSITKPSFHRFHVQECRTEAAARKFLADAGVVHYFDLAANFTDEDQG